MSSNEKNLQVKSVKNNRKFLGLIIAIRMITGNIKMKQNAKTRIDIRNKNLSKILLLHYTNEFYNMIQKLK